MSHRPGIKNLPEASTDSASAGGSIVPVLPIAVMRLAEMTTVMSGWAGAPVESITVTWNAGAWFVHVEETSIVPEGAHSTTSLANLSEDQAVHAVRASLLTEVDKPTDAQWDEATNHASAAVYAAKYNRPLPKSWYR